MKDYYKILQIDPDASLEVMNNAYRALVKQYHPDLYHTQRKTVMDEKMREINEAYQVLSNATTRAEYDRKRQSYSSNSVARPVQSLGQILKRMLFWGVGTYVFMRFLLVPFLSNPLAKILLLVVCLFILVQIYRKRKTVP